MITRVYEYITDVFMIYNVKMILPLVIGLVIC